MAKPITIPNTFASATSAIPLSQLDQDFSTLANATNDLATYSNYVADTGAADAYITNFPANTNTASLTAGLIIQFKAANANTGASTLNVQVNGGSIGTAAIRYADGTSLAAGAIAAGAIVTVMYDGTNFQLLNDPAGKTGGDVTGPSSATDNAIARFDGTTGRLIQNSVVTIADTTGDMSGVGNLTAANVTVSALTSGRVIYATTGGNLTDSANLTFNGTTLTANTIGAFTLGGTIAGGGNQINNIVIGASTPLAGSFTTLSASGVATFSAGTVSAPAITTTGDTNTGIFFPAADTIAFAEGGVEAMRIDSSGNVGIGTTTPSSSGVRLAVSGAANVYGDERKLLALIDTTALAAGVGAGISFQGVSESGGGTSQFGSIKGIKENATSANYAGALAFVTSNSSNVQTERMRIDSSGNVGIGNTPSGTSATGYRSLELGTTAGTGITAGNGDFYVPVNAYVAGGAWKYAVTGQTASLFNAAGNVYTWSQAASGTAGNNISFSERMRITSGGDLCVGTTASQASARLSVVKASSDYTMYVENTNATSGDKTYRSILGANTNNTNSFHFSANAAGGDRCYIYGNGNIVNSNNSYGTLSDIKLKENIVDASPKLNDVMKLQVRNFNLKSDANHKQIGFVAQELEQVFPSLIDESPEFDEDGKTLDTTVKSIKTSVLIPILVKAIQELVAEVNTLKAEVAALKK